MRIVLGPSSFACMVGSTAAATVEAARTLPLQSIIMPSSAPSLSVRLETQAYTLFALLASSGNKTPEEYAADVLYEHCEAVVADKDRMARVLKQSLGLDIAKPAKASKPKLAPEAPPKLDNRVIEPDGTPPGFSRTKDGEVLSNAEIKRNTLCTEEAARVCNTSPATLLRAIRENAVVPYAYVNSKKYPRWRTEEMQQVHEWQMTPCTKSANGNQRRTHRCPKCGAYFSKAGLRMHIDHCKYPLPAAM